MPTLLTQWATRLGHRGQDDGDSDVYWTREDMCVWNDNETEWDCFYWDHEDDEYHESTWWYYCEFIGASDATEVDRMGVHG